MADNKNNNQTEKSSAPNKPTVGGFFRTLGRWLGRMFFGASKTELDVFAVEKLESPTTLAVKEFFRRKLAVCALILLISMFLFVFIGPSFFPMQINYTDPLQANIAPNYSMLSVPSAMSGQVREINGFSNFTVGVSEDNTLYIWGYTKDALSGKNYAKFPDEIQPGKVLTAAAGSDHIIAITTDGYVVGWGTNNCGQYGEANEADGYRSMANELADFWDGTGWKLPDPSKVEYLTCGYQVTALIYDGHAYVWGNTRNCLNMLEVVGGNLDNVAKAAFTNYNIVLLYKDGTVYGGRNLFFRQSATSSISGTIKSFDSYMADFNVIDVAATNNCFAFLLETGELLVSGSPEYGENVMPVIPSSEKFVKIVGGTRHFVALTDGNSAYAWGHNQDGQANVLDKDANNIFAGAKQTYLVDANGKLTYKCGLKGYIFGTDSLGRDTFTRIVHGGKMTMTIGAVAVIVSSIIAIIIGCVSGYFGGWIDMLLMRVTEIFSAIPFLPFAMMLSYVIRNYPVGEKTRIFIIMVILGLLSWTGLARMIRAQVLSEREKEFVIAAQSMGVKENRIAFKHILPNVISVILVSMTLDFAGCLLTESSLSYLGFGVQQPQPTWGNMLNGANNSIVIQNYWWQWLFPSLFLSLATISINIIGDNLRDVLDPKSSREK